MKDSNEELYRLAKYVALFCLMLIVFAMTGCAELNAAKSGIASHGATAADDVLEASIWSMCNAVPVGAIKRRFKTPEEVEAYNTLCSQSSESLGLPVAEAAARQ